MLVLNNQRELEVIRTVYLSGTREYCLACCSTQYTKPNTCTYTSKMYNVKK